MKTDSKTIYVFAHWEGMKQPLLMGELKATLLRGKEIFSFSYSDDWLKSGYSQVMDPELQFLGGYQHLTDEKANFGLFMDSAPDRWGRVIMKRREAALARLEQRQARTLIESDYLLGVYDGHRIGAMRFKTDINGPFVNDNIEFAAPPMAKLGELEKISLKLEEEDVIDDPNYLKWLTMLVNPGSSLGGARPKANVICNDGGLWIAKFPAKSDTKDIGGWEKVANELAVNAGLNVAESMLHQYSGRYHTFLSRRFDRTASGERIHFASAMTMLGYADGTGSQYGASYLEIVDFLTCHGADTDKDLMELWSRIACNVIIANTDDHLRNHGFLLSDKGWSLSPAYDMNPNEEGTGLSLNISLDDNDLDLDLVFSVADYFRIDKKIGTGIVDRIKRSVSKWKNVAAKYGIPKSEQDLMSKVFDKFL